MHRVDDLSQLSLRELLTLARERLGKAAAGLKTRAELIAALSGAPPAAAAQKPPEPAATPSAPGEVVTRDFFVARR